MCSVLDTGLSGPGSSPGQGHRVVFLELDNRQFTPTVPLSTQVYKWVLANLLLGVTLCIPSKEGVETS